MSQAAGDESTHPATEAWNAFVGGLQEAGDKVADAVAGLEADEAADAYRALIRALNNQLSRFEVDRDRPELVYYNGWRERFFMDNPDFQYWVADISDSGRYRIVGESKTAAYVSVTAYTGTGPAGAEATGRLDSDTITIGDDGTYEIVVSRDDPGVANWLPLAEGTSSVWVRHFHDGGGPSAGSCWIEPVEPPPPPPPIDAPRFNRQLTRLGKTMAFVPGAWSGAAKAEAGRTNEIRHWSEMSQGAVYTEPGIHYLRGAWDLDDGEALVIDGPVVGCRYWNVLLYSRSLNSLDFRSRTVSYTGATATVSDGRYRFVLASGQPPAGTGDWLDTEGRRFGFVVFRWLHPVAEPELPTVTRRLVSDLDTRP